MSLWSRVSRFVGGGDLSTQTNPQPPPERHAVETVWEAWRLLWEMDAYVKRRLYVALVLVGVSAVLNGLAPVALKGVADGLSKPDTSASLPVFAFVALYTISMWLARIADELRQFSFGKAEQRIYRSLSERLFSHVIRLPMQFHLGRKIGAVSEAFTTGLQGLQYVLYYTVFTVLPVVLELGTVVIVLLYLDHPTFMVIFVLVLLCYAAAFGWSVVRIAGPARAAASAQVDARGLMVDYISNVELLKYFGAEASARRQVDDALLHGENHSDTYNTRRFFSGVLVRTIFAVFIGFTVSYAVLQVQSGEMTLGDFVLVTAYMLQLVRPVETLGMALQQLARGLAYVERMLVLKREAPEPDQGGATLAPGGKGELSFEHVRLSYRAGSPVVDDVCFRLPAGKTLGIVGATGAGKSTLLRLVARFIEPDSGKILLDGQPISDLSLASLRQAIAVVPQETVMLNDSIAANIRLGGPDSSDAEIERAARLAKLHDFVMQQPDGYQTTVGERGIRLSGGERQRLSIARALLRRPRIFWFDEATAALDSMTERAIVANLRDIATRATTVVVAHRLSSVEHADEIIVLDRGSVIERGTHAELLAQEGRYAELWRAQGGGGATPPP